MARLPLTLACRDYDRTLALRLGQVSREGITLGYHCLNYFYRSDRNAIETLKARGMAVVETGPADRKRLAEARTLFWEDVVEKSPKCGAQLRTIMEPYTK